MYPGYILPILSMLLGFMKLVTRLAEIVLGERPNPDELGHG
jgi:hypothetical protein